MPATKKVLTLKKVKETKGFVVFEGDSLKDRSATTPVYIAKDVAAELGLDDTVKVTLEGKASS